MIDGCMSSAMTNNIGSNTKATLSGLDCVHPLTMIWLSLQALMLLSWNCRELGNS